jgi:MFS family permease
MDLAARPVSAAPVLVSVALSSFMVALDVTALNVALPSIGRDLATGMDRLQWIAGAYTLVFASLLLSAGALSDRLGAKKVFLFALLVFTSSSLACGLAQGVVELIAARAIQGIGAALMLPSSMALLVEAYPDPKARAKAVALWGGISALALVSGPLLGGMLVELVDWRSIFYLNVPFCLIALGCCVIRSSRLAIQPRSIDWAGQMLSALASLIFALIEGPGWGWDNAWVIVTLLVALVSGAAFIYSQQAQREPMLPLNLFESRTFSAAIGAGFLQTLAYYGSLFVLPFALQGQGRTPVEIGSGNDPNDDCDRRHGNALGAVVECLRCPFSRCCRYALWSTRGCIVGAVRNGSRQSGTRRAVDRAGRCDLAGHRRRLSGECAKRQGRRRFRGTQCRAPMWRSDRYCLARRLARRVGARHRRLIDHCPVVLCRQPVDRAAAVHRRSRCREGMLTGAPKLTGECFNE